MARAHKQPQRQPVQRLRPDPALGLTARQAEERAQAGWDNRDPNQLTRSTGQILRDNLVTFFNFLFLAFALVLFAVGRYRDMLFLGIAVVNVLIGIVQELRVKHALDRICSHRHGGPGRAGADHPGPGAGAGRYRAPVRRGPGVRRRACAHGWVHLPGQPGKGAAALFWPAAPPGGGIFLTVPLLYRSNILREDLLTCPAVS